MNDYEKLIQSPMHRRAFLTRMTAAGLGTAAAALLAGCGSKSGTLGTVATPSPSPSTSPTPVVGILPAFPGVIGRSADEVVLNYALTLEILEADLYRQALNLASGRPLTQALDATPPSGVAGTGAYSLKISAGGIASARQAAGFAYLAQYAYVEAAHRDFLRTALQAIGAPTVTANPAGYTANFGTTLESILNLLYVVEETGVRAYLGAAGYMNNIQYLTTAVAIHSTEARHSAGVAYVLGKSAGPVYMTGDKNPINNATTPNPSPYSENTFQYYLDPATVLTAVKPFIVGA